MPYPMRDLLKGLAGSIRHRANLHILPYLASQTAEQNRKMWDLDKRVRSLQEALGRIEARQTAAIPSPDLESHEFRVYSQWGEDGIIQHLLRHVEVPRKVFVEFGVEDYEESNTRFLLVNDNWSGLVLDGSEENVARIRKSRIYWLHNLKASQAFITRENIDGLLEDHGITGEIGLLSIDIDGMDYWVWEALHVVNPAIVIMEYNHLFGPDAAVTVPYDAAFRRREAHPSLVYYGASLKALCRLGRRKGYAFVGCGSNGLNAFFVRRDLLPSALPERSCEEGFVAGGFCEAHDEAGHRVKMSHDDQMRLLHTLPLVNVDEEDAVHA